MEIFNLINNALGLPKHTILEQREHPSSDKDKNNIISYTITATGEEIDNPYTIEKEIKNKDYNYDNKYKKDKYYDKYSYDNKN